MIKLKATIKDVAQAAHVSTATVSRVLSNKKGTYREETAQLVRKVADQLGYRRNLSAAELASRHVKTIAIIINNTQTNFWQEVLDGIQAGLQENHRDSIIFYAGNNDEQLLTNAINNALSRSVSGILLVAAKPTPQQLQMLKNSGLPYRFVSIYGSDDQQVQYTSSNNIEIGELATNYLIQHGHQKIGLLGIDKSTTGNQRLLGYEKVMTKENLVVKPSWVQYGNYSFANGQQLFKKIRHNGLTAIIAASDMAAAGIIKAARQDGYRIPEDFSIISIDGTFLCDITMPSLTSVSQNFFSMGKQSVINLINQDDSQFIPVSIVERNSVQNIN